MPPARRSGNFRCIFPNQGADHGPGHSLPRNETGIETVVGILKQRLGDRCQTGAAIREQHGHTTTYIQNQSPDAVVFPHSTEEVAEIVKTCAAHKVPVIPFGTGTSLEGHVNAPAGGISVDLMQMNTILAVHPGDLDCVVQPGVTREDLNTHLRDQGLFFPIDPGANASLGGMASTRASGTNAVRYGTMKDNVLALEVVMPDGEVIRTAQRAKKSSAGYDLTRLMVGAEGTLGLITEITLRLQGIPEAISSARCSFPSVDAACQAVMMTIQYGIPVARMELLDALSVSAANAYSKLDLPETPLLLLEFHGSDAGVAEQAETFQASPRNSAAAISPPPPAPRSAASSGRRATTCTGPATRCGPAPRGSAPMSAFRSRNWPNASVRRRPRPRSWA